MKVVGFILVLGVVTFAIFEIIGIVRDIKERKRVKNKSSGNLSSEDNKK